MAVVQHGAVNHTFVVLSKMFQVLIVGSYYAKGLCLPELLEHSLGYRTSDGWLGTATKLVYQQQRSLVGMLHHLLHVHQMT